ncbi:hypothetical protein [Psychrobacter immobilis]|uniref:hypothetical protein n=1 Tax=Psychrobacter immobilis TaxID=498 RepID=UPI001917F7D0|nr:hypothetical protein [Psychrobacter immobilis]
MTMPESLSAPSDKVIYQVGLNALQYQEIERTAKRLIELSDYTVTSSDISKDRPTPISWSFNPSVNTTKNTMGSLVSLLCDLQDVDENKESDDKDEFKISFKMSHGVIDRQRIQNLFQKIITDRNNFTHHFENYYVDPNSNSKKSHDEVLKILRLEYRDAEYLLEKLKNELVVKIDFIRDYIRLSFDIMTIDEIANTFDAAYQSCKRNDDWAVWQQVMNFVHKESEAQTSIESLKKQRNIKSTKNMLKLIFPKWLFREEPTKNGSRILVKVDNTSVNIDIVSSK